jgi:nitrite reductase (NADH) large subunit
LVGAILLGDTNKAAYLLQVFDRNTPLLPERAALLFDIGGAAKQDSITDMPDDTQVCNCGGVTQRAIRQCIRNGNRSLASVMTATRAGMGCGSCKGRVQEWCLLLQR